MSDSPGLVDFAVLGLVDFTLNLPEGQVKVLQEILVEEIRASWKIELLCTLAIEYVRFDCVPSILLTVNKYFLECINFSKLLITTYKLLFSTGCCYDR